MGWGQGLAAGLAHPQPERARPSSERGQGAERDLPPMPLTPLQPQIKTLNDFLILKGPSPGDMAFLG